MTWVEVSTALPARDFALGESIAIDGCCLTVVERREGYAAFQASPETLRRTTLGGWRVGTRVNLERAMALEIGSEGTWCRATSTPRPRFLRVWAEGGSRCLEIRLPAPLAPFFIEKGSVSVDGVSLTVNTLTDDRFGLALIPETQERTTLGTKAVGAPVNLEADLIGKYVARLAQLNGGGRPGLDAEALRKAGFATG